MVLLRIFSYFHFKIEKDLSKLMFLKCFFIFFLFIFLQFTFKMSGYNVLIESNTSKVRIKL